MLDSFNPTTLNLTEGAVRKIHSLSDTKLDREINLRVYVTGGGCSGFQYGFSFDQEIDEEDTRVSKDGATLIVDPLSLQYLAGSTIDYRTLEQIDLSDRSYRSYIASSSLKIGLQYYLNSNMNIGFEPTLMYFTNSIYTEDYPFEVIPYSMGLNVNLQMKLQ